MTTQALLLVLLAAAIHATWNALAKRSSRPFLFLWSISAAACVVLAPILIVAILRGELSGDGIYWASITIVIHALYFVCLANAYERGDLSLVYPISRGLGVALAPVVAWWISDERLSPLGIAGIAVVVAGIAAIGLRGDDGRVRIRPGAGTWWSVVTGLLVATYSAVDKAGVTELSPMIYASLLWIGSATLQLPLVLRDRARLRSEWRENGRRILLGAALSMASYIIVLFAFRLAKTGYVVAAREVSVVLSVVIGSVFLGEGKLRPRLAGALLIVAGVVCIALAD